MDNRYIEAFGVRRAIIYLCRRLGIFAEAPNRSHEIAGLIAGLLCIAFVWALCL